MQWTAVTNIRDQSVQHWSAAIKWKNSGKTPTRHLRISFNKSIRDDVLPNNFDFPDLGAADIPLFVSPGTTLESTYLDITLDETERVINGRSHLYFYGWAEYDDVFDQTARHRTEFCYKIWMGGDPRVPAHFSVRWSVHPAYNSADEECRGPLRTTSFKCSILKNEDRTHARVSSPESGSE